MPIMPPGAAKRIACLGYQPPQRCSRPTADSSIEPAWTCVVQRNTELAHLLKGAVPRAVALKISHQFAAPFAVKQCVKRCRQGWAGR